MFCLWLDQLVNVLLMMQHSFENKPVSACRLRDDTRTNRGVLDYLEAENAYTDAVLKDTEGLQELLYKEMRGRIQEADWQVARRYVRVAY